MADDSKAAKMIAQEEMRRSKRRRTAPKLGDFAPGSGSLTKRERRRGAQFHCNYCNRDISGCIRIKCAECSDFDLCIDCFSVGAEITPHRKTHAYRVIDNMHDPIFELGWGADEELLLLEGIEMYGLGNWLDISEHVGRHSAEECKSHYFRVFIDSQTGPLPDMSKPAPTPDRAEEAETVKIEPESDPKGNESGTSKSKAKVDMRKKKGKQAEKSSSMVNEIGFMPRRGEFDVEWENDAEMILADMEFEESDSMEDRELKFRILEVYNWKLDERARRRTFLLKRGLVDGKKMLQHDRRRSKEDREIYNQMRVFARFHSHADHEKFVQGLLNERALRKKIEELQKYRQCGLRNQSDIEQLQQKKKESESSRKNRDNTSYLYTTPKTHSYRRRGETEEEMRNRDRREILEPLDISSMAGVELLALRERDLCSRARIKPETYMAVKDIFIRESFRIGYLQRIVARQLATMCDDWTASLIYDFILACGWIKDSPTTDGS